MHRKESPKRYRVCVNDVPIVYGPNYFPRNFRLKREALDCAQRAVDEGASMARVEFPDGGELDFYPKPPPKGTKRPAGKIVLTPEEKDTLRSYIPTWENFVFTATPEGLGEQLTQFPGDESEPSDFVDARKPDFDKGLLELLGFKQYGVSQEYRKELYPRGDYLMAREDNGVLRILYLQKGDVALAGWDVHEIPEDNLGNISPPKPKKQDASNNDWLLLVQTNAQGNHYREVCRCYNMHSKAAAQKVLKNLGYEEDKWNK